MLLRNTVYNMDECLSNCKNRGAFTKITIKLVLQLIFREIIVKKYILSSNSLEIKK